MSITTLTRRLAILQRAVARSVTDDVDLALTVVAIEIDSLHGESYTREDVDRWFLENYDGPLEEHLGYIQQNLADLCDSAALQS